MNEMIAEIQKRFRGYFERLAEDLRLRHPGIRFNLYEEPVGSLTTFQGYNLGIEATLSGPSDPDNVAFDITLCHLTTQPRIMVSASWGHGGGGGCRSLWEDLSNDDWPLASSERLDEISNRLHELAEWFVQEVKRGKPEA